MRFRLTLLVVAIVIALAGFLPGQPIPPPVKKPAGVDGDPAFMQASTARVWRPDHRRSEGGHFVYFRARQSMWGKDRKIDFKKPAAMKAIQLPIDWARNLVFPMYLNDQLGDCYYAAGCHADNTWTGNSAVKSEFSLSAIRARYLTLSGGDNGLTDDDMQGEMLSRYLADLPAARIVSWANLSPVDSDAMQNAILNYGNVLFTLAVPISWINNSSTGAVWDAVNWRRNNNGHAVLINGVRENGDYRVQTWGSYVWLTQAGAKVCEPGAWVGFSTRWVGVSGYAPNGRHIRELAASWQLETGKTIPESVLSQYPPPVPGPPPPIPPIPPSPPTPPSPPPPPGPVGRITWTIGGNAAEYELFPVGTWARFAALRDLVYGFDPVSP